MGTISKALSLLNHFTSDRPEIGLGEFVRLSKRDKATVHRYLSELAENGFLEQNPVSRAYRLGPAVLRLSSLREALFPVQKLLRPIVVELADAVGELAHASLLQNDALSPVIHADPRRYGVQVHFDVTEMLPLHATSSGIAALAFCPATFRDSVLDRPLVKHTDQTITDPSVLRPMVQDAQRYGLCSLAGTFDDGVTSVGAPLFADGAQVAGALAVAIPSARVKPGTMRNLGTQVLRRAEQATVALGGTFPTSFKPLPQEWGASFMATS